MNFDQWYDSFKPVMAKDGETIRDFMEESRVFTQPIMKQLNDNRYVWTVLDVDGELIITTGLHFVNRYAYYLCNEKYTDDQEGIEIPMLSEEDKAELQGNG